MLTQDYLPLIHKHVTQPINQTVKRTKVKQQLTTTTSHNQRITVPTPTEITQLILINYTEPKLDSRTLFNCPNLTETPSIKL